MNLAPVLWLLLSLQEPSTQGPEPTTQGPEPVAAANPGFWEGRTVERLSLDIPDGIERQEVASLIALKLGEPFSMTTVDLDIRRLYLSLPLDNVLVFAEPVGSLVRVRYVLQPRIIVGKVVIRGSRHFDEQELKTMLEVKEGAEFRRSAVKGVGESLRRHYEEQGYYQSRVEVDVVDRGPRRVDLELEVEEGPRAVIGQVRINGDDEALSWLRAAMRLPAGRPYSRTAIEEAQRRAAKALIERGYREHRLGEPAVVWDAVANAVSVDWAIETGPVVEIVFQGNRFFTSRDLIDLLDLDESTPLPPGGAEELARRIKEIYQRWGFILAEVALDVERTGEDAQRYRFQIQEDKRRFISSIRFFGNSAIGEGAIYDAQGLRTRRWYSLLFSSEDGTFPSTMRSENDAQILQLYRRSGFLDAAIADRRLEEQGSDLALVYQLDEGIQTRVREIEFHGNAVLADDVLAEALALRSGEPFDPFLFDRGVDRIRASYRRLGFLDAKVEGDSRYGRHAGEVDIEVRVNEGPQYRVGQIFLQGNTRTDDEVIRRHLILRTGDIANPELLLATQRRLYRLGIFGSVNLDILSKDSRAEVANVIVKVQEKANGSLDFGVGLGTAEGLSLGAELAHRNLWGTARSFRLLGEISYLFSNVQNVQTPTEYHVDLGYREPWLFATEWSGRINYITELSRRERTFNYTVNRIVLGTDRAFGEHWRLIPQYSWEKDTFFHKRPPVDCRVEQAAGDRCRNLDVPNVNLLAGDANRTYYVAGFDSFVLADFRDDQFNPKDGWVSTYRLFYAAKPLGSDFHFLRQDVLLGRYLPLGGRWSLNVVLRGGYIMLFSPSDFLIKPQKYVLGGVNSVRGFGLDRIYIPVGGDAIPSGEDGGLAMFNYQIDLRFPLMWNLGGAVFHDAGRIWNGLSDLSLPLLYTAGTGLRYDTPIGPIRLDIGWKLNRRQIQEILNVPAADLLSPWELHFAIGAPF